MKHPTPVEAEHSSPHTNSDIHTQSATPSELDVEAGSDTTHNEPRLYQGHVNDKQVGDPYVVQFDASDKSNPRLWTLRYKVAVTLQLASHAFAASLASSILSPANETIAREFNVSSQVMILDISLYLLGYAFGPMAWAPISEVWGRRLSIIPAMFCMCIFSLGAGFSQSAAALFATRFFAGFFGSAPVSNVSAALGDLFEPYQRGLAIALYAVCVVGGPMLAPIIGSSLTVTVGWRWTLYLVAIVTGVVVFVTVFTLPETYEPVLLKRKAEAMRVQTRDSTYHHPHEKVKLNFKSIVTKHLARPIFMLLTEPIITVVAIYASFVYALLYMSLEWVPIIFATERGWGPIVSTLPFLSLFIGVVCALGINIGAQPFYHRACDRAGGKAVPEARLPPIMIGGLLFGGGLFWLAWTAAPKYHWVLPCFALAFVGAGFNVIFQQCINYLVDSYSLYAASAVSANTILRSILAAGLPLAVQPMYKSLGVSVSLSILGAIAGLAVPVPFLFYHFGPSIRRRSRFALQ